MPSPIPILWNCHHHSYHLHSTYYVLPFTTIEQQYEVDITISLLYKWGNQGTENEVPETT